MSAPLGLYAKLVLMTALWGGQFIAGRTLAPATPAAPASAQAPG